MNHKIWLLFGMVMIIASMAADGQPVDDTENKKASTAEPDHSDTKDKKVGTQSTNPTAAPSKSRREATTASPPLNPVLKTVEATTKSSVAIDRSRRGAPSTTSTPPSTSGTTTKQVPGRFSRDAQAPNPSSTQSPQQKVLLDRLRRDSGTTTTPKSTTKSGSGKHRRAATTTPSPPKNSKKSGSDTNKTSSPKPKREATTTPSPAKSHN